MSIVTDFTQNDSMDHNLKILWVFFIKLLIFSLISFICKKIQMQKKNKMMKHTKAFLT